MSQMLHLGEIIAMNARLFPGKTGGRDLHRSMTFRQWNNRACRLANALIGLGLEKGDQDLVAALDGDAGFCRPHVFGAQREDFSFRFHHREHGRT